MSGVAIKRGSTQGRLPGAGRALHASRVVVINPALMSCAAALFLSLLGVVVIGTTEPGYAARHAMLLSISLVTACVVAWVHPRTWCQLALPGMVFTLGLLVFVLVPWIPDALVHPRHGARRWINLGLIDMQPSELAKVSYIVVLAAYFRYRKNHRSLRGLVIPLVLTLIPIGLILVEPDLGTSLLFLPTLFAMLIAAGARFKHLLILVLLGLLAAGCMAPLLKPHQRARIAAMVAHVQGDTQFDHDIGFQGARARTLIGAGGLTGLGREQASVLIEYNHLPEEHNDMVFAVIGCRWGLLGAGVTWLAFLVLGRWRGDCSSPHERSIWSLVGGWYCGDVGEPNAHQHWHDHWSDAHYRSDPSFCELWRVKPDYCLDYDGAAHGYLNAKITNTCQIPL